MASEKPPSGEPTPDEGDLAEERPVVSIGEGLPVGDVVSVGDVSDEVREELARLFGSSEKSEPVDDEPTTPESPTLINDVTGEIPDHTSPKVSFRDSTAGSDGAENADTTSDSDSEDVPPTKTRVQRFARRRRERREVVPIGDPNFDSIAPLPVDQGSDTFVVGDPLGGGSASSSSVSGDATADDNAVVRIVDDFARPELQDASEVSRVVIIDDERSGSRSEVRERRRNRRRKLRQVKWLRIVGFVVGGFIFVSAVLASPLFAIRQVTFEGAVYTAPETVDKVRDLLKGASIFTVDTALARRTLLDDPWVADVRITTDFPGGALVEVSERDPVVWYVGEDQKARVVDDRGHVIAVLDGWPTKYLQVKGTGPSVDAGATTDDAYRAAAQLVLALPAEIKGKVAALELSAGGELSMELKGGTVVRFGPPEGLQDKLVAVVVLLRRQDPSTLAVVDVSTGEATVQTR